MNTKNIFFTLFVIFAANLQVNCSDSASSSSMPASPTQQTVSFRLSTTEAQERLRKGLKNNNFEIVNEALQMGANPNEIITHTPFGERTCFNAYLAEKGGLNIGFLKAMLSRGATPTVDTDRIIEAMPRNDHQQGLKALIANCRRNMYRKEMDQRLKGSENISPLQHHVDPTALQ